MTVMRKETFKFNPLYGEPPSDEVDEAWKDLMPRVSIPPFTILGD